MRCWTEEWISYYQWWFLYYRVANNYMDYSNPTVKVWIDRITLEDIFDALVEIGKYLISNMFELGIPFFKELGRS